MPQADPKSSTGQEQQQSFQTVPYPTPYPQHFDDAIDLYEVWITLCKWKWLVFAMTLVAALGSIVYARQLQGTYKAEALLLPPKMKDILTVNVPGIQHNITRDIDAEVKLISVSSVFSKFKLNLQSRILHKKFVQEKGLMGILAPDRTVKTRDEDVFQRFTKLIKIEEKSGFTSLSIEMHDAEIAAQWVNDFIELVDKETITMMVEDLRNQIANQIKNVEYTISSKRKMVEQRRKDQIRSLERTIESKRKMAIRRSEDKILRYKEAAKTAKSLGIMTGFTQQTKLVESTSNGVSKVMGGSSPIAQMNVDIATATTPLFFIGYDALTAELENLNSRIDQDPFIPGLRDLQEQVIILNTLSSDDPFIEGLRDLQEQLVLLHSIKFDPAKLTAVNIDQAAYPSNTSINPDRRLIISITTVVGLFSGIFLAFLIQFVQNQRKKHSE